MKPEANERGSEARESGGRNVGGFTRENVGHPADAVAPRANCLNYTAPAAE